MKDIDYVRNFKLFGYTGSYYFWSTIIVSKRKFKTVDVNFYYDPGPLAPGVTIGFKSNLFQKQYTIGFTAFKQRSYT